MFLSRGEAEDIVSANRTNVELNNMSLVENSCREKSRTLLE